MGILACFSSTVDSLYVDTEETVEKASIYGRYKKEWNFVYKSA